MSTSQNISNASIRSKLQAEHSIIDGIQRRQLEWYEQLLRMEDSQSLAEAASPLDTANLKSKTATIR